MKLSKRSFFGTLIAAIASPWSLLNPRTGLTMEILNEQEKLMESQPDVWSSELPPAFYQARKQDWLGTFDSRDSELYDCGKWIPIKSEENRSRHRLE